MKAHIKLLHGDSTPSIFENHLLNMGELVVTLDTALALLEGICKEEEEEKEEERMPILHATFGVYPKATSSEPRSDRT